MSKSNQARFSVYVGGGIGELHDVKSGLTFKQAVQAWVRGQKRCPTDVAIEPTEEEIDERGFLGAEEHLAATINELVAANREWVENEIAKQGVYSARIIEYRNPFTRG